MMSDNIKFFTLLAHQNLILYILLMYSLTLLKIRNRCGVELFISSVHVLFNVIQGKKKKTLDISH